MFFKCLWVVADKWSYLVSQSERERERERDMFKGWVGIIGVS